MPFSFLTSVLFPNSVAFWAISLGLLSASFPPSVPRSRSSSLRVGISTVATDCSPYLSRSLSNLLSLAQFSNTESSSSIRPLVLPFGLLSSLFSPHSPCYAEHRESS